MSRLRQENEFFGATVSPTGRNGDPIFVVDGMPKLSGVKAFGLGIGVHDRVEQSSILPHLTPLLTTCEGAGQ